MVQGFLDHISTLLHSPEVEVSYFAAGICADKKKALLAEYY